MMTRFDPTNPNFDQWLDGFVRGESTPNDETSNDDPESRQLRQAAGQFHDLAGRVDAVMGDPATNKRLDHIWENVMMNTQAPAVTAAIGPGGVISGGSAGRTNPLFARHRWPSIVNSLVAAALILGLGFGMWQTFQGLSGGNGPEPTQFAGLVQGDPTETAGPTEVPATVAPDSTPSGELTGGDGGEPTVVPEGSAAESTPTVVPQVGPYDPPTAEDCKVEPLTVDEVLAIVDSYAVGGDLVNLPETVEVPDVAREQGTVNNVNPNKATMDTIMAVHREWMACAMAKSQFQMWALTSEFTIATEVTNRIYPLYRTREEGRALLEELRDHGTINSEPYFFPVDAVDIDPDPGNSVQLSDGLIQLGWVRYDHFGNVVKSESSSYAELIRQTPFSGQSFYVYTWDRVEGGWEIYDNDAGGLG
jgi:hypothetical protein